eukprot:GHUV01054839.1.p1 GENE.GHUV01054839.1~~GHUV01054839.1.p1  ORF type:complete len:106 (-),score=5.27 GHUV01054839.1:146-463(-)
MHSPMQVMSSADVCMACMQGSYSLDPSAAVCEPCPTSADCPGGAVVSPLPGMWHSAPFCDQVHRCVGCEHRCAVTRLTGTAIAGQLQKPATLGRPPNGFVLLVPY